MINTRTYFFIFLLSINYPVLKLTNTFNKPATSLFGLINKNDNGDAILGKWMTLEHNLEVEVYKEDNIFRAKIIWFKVDDPSRPMDSFLDVKNPNPKLRSRKWLGMEVLRDLKYNADDNDWEGGVIYDAKHGREWDSVVWINDKGLLKVKGYWVFRWISETLTFSKVP